MKKHPDEYKPHVVILPGYSPVAIFVTRSMAIEYAIERYGDDYADKRKNIRVQPATAKDFKVT